MRLALQSHPRILVVGEVTDGIETIAYLSGEGQFADRKQYPFPDLIILDLKMPRKTGYEVLEWLQAQSFEGLLVVVVSGSVLPEDRERSVRLGADAFYVKTAERREREAMVRSIEDLLKKPRRHKAARM